MFGNTGPLPTDAKWFFTCSASNLTFGTASPNVQLPLFSYLSQPLRLRRVLAGLGGFTLLRQHFC